MLLVSTRVGPSNIHGLGLFAVEPIPRGSAVWRFTPGFDLEVDPTLVAAQPQRFRDTLLWYGYIDARLHRYILCCDDARFMNHSDTPNVDSRIEDDPYGLDVAVRDIAPGDEITIDYALIEGMRPEAAPRRSHCAPTIF